MIENAVTGLLVRCGDVDGLASAALEILADPQRRQAMSQAARERAVGRFGREAAVDLYESCYRRVLGR